MSDTGGVDPLPINDGNQLLATRREIEKEEEV
jgi:hypothetical protein